MFISLELIILVGASGAVTVCTSGAVPVGPEISPDICNVLPEISINEYILPILGAVTVGTSGAVTVGTSGAVTVQRIGE